MVHRICKRIGETMKINIENIKKETYGKDVWSYFINQNNLQEDEEDGPILLIENYKYDHRMMYDDERLPFILSEGKIKWNISIKRVLVSDLINTFGIKGSTISYCFKRMYGVNKTEINSKKIIKQFMHYWEKYAISWGKTEWKIKKEIRQMTRVFLRWPVLPQTVIQSFMELFTGVTDSYTISTTYGIKFEEAEILLDFFGCQKKVMECFT